MVKLWPHFFAMIGIVAASNYLVQFPLNEWLTLSAFTYPVSFLVTEIANRFHGPRLARRIVYAGFVVAVLLSAWVATPKIAFASGLAFLVSQLLDISIFNKFRQKNCQGNWWIAPFFSSILASTVDSAIFWSVAFWGENLPLFTWAFGDLSVKVLMDLAMLTPFRFAIRSKSIV